MRTCIACHRPARSTTALHAEQPWACRCQLSCLVACDRTQYLHIWLQPIPDSPPTMPVNQPGCLPASLPMAAWASRSRDRCRRCKTNLCTGSWRTRRLRRATTWHAPRRCPWCSAPRAQSPAPAASWPARCHCAPASRCLHPHHCSLTTLQNVVHAHVARLERQAVPPGSCSSWLAANLQLVSSGISLPPGSHCRCAEVTAPTHTESAHAPRGFATG